MAVVGARGPKYVPAPTLTAAMHGRMTSVTWSLTERVLFWTPVPRSRYKGLPRPLRRRTPERQRHPVPLRVAGTSAHELHV